MRSIPTSETRTQASMTIPLSSTRSRTSIRLEPPAARSTAIHCLLGNLPLRSPPIEPLGAQSGSALRRTWRRFQLPLESSNFFLELLVFHRQLVAPQREMTIVTPPVQPDLFGLVDRTDHQADADGQQLDFSDGNLDVAGDHQPLVEYAIEYVDEAA